MQFQRQLNLTRRAGADELPDGVQGPSEREIIYCLIRRIEVCMIEQVEKFRPEFDVLPFHERGFLNHREIRLRELVAEHDTIGAGSERAVREIREGLGIPQSVWHRIVAI